MAGLGVALSRSGPAGSETTAMSTASRNEGRTAMTATSMKCRRELAHRASSGIEVFLFWDACSNDVSIEVVDQRGDSAFELGGW